MEPCYLYTVIRLPKGLIFSTRIMLFLPRLVAFLCLCWRSVHSLVVVLQGLAFLIPFFLPYAKIVLKLQITYFFIAILHIALGHILFVNVIFLCLLARLFGHFFNLGQCYISHPCVRLSGSLFHQQFYGLYGGRGTLEMFRNKKSTIQTFLFKLD